MGIVTVRPTASKPYTLGSWALAGGAGNLPDTLNDDSDLTYAYLSAPSRTKETIATFDMDDLVDGSDVPSGAKIKGITYRAKVLQIAPAGGSSFLTQRLVLIFEIWEEVVEYLHDGDLGDFITDIFALFHHPPVPTPPGNASATWQILQKTFPSKPSGGEWTVDIINGLTFAIGRADAQAVQTRVSEYYLDVEYNEAPEVEILGPTETRVLADAVTTNADATLTSATGDFSARDVGATITGTGIPGGTTIASINSATSVELSANATATATGVSVTIVRKVIAKTTRPIVTIAYSDVEDDPMAAVRFRIFTADQTALGSFDVETTPPIAASAGVGNWILGPNTTQWLCPVDLPDNDYVVFAQVKQQWDVPNVEHKSQWDAYDFTMDVEGPAKPDVVVTNDPVNNWNQINISVADNDPPAETYNIYRSDNAGISYDLIWSGWQWPADETTGAASIIDYLAPANQNALYIVKGYTTLGTIKVASDASDPVGVIPATNEFWLKSPLAPSLNQAIGWMDDSPGETQDQGIYYPLVADGVRAYPIVLNGPLRGIQGDSKLLFLDANDETWEKFKAIRAANHTLLLQFPTGEQHWIRLKGDAKWTWHTGGTTHVDFRILEWGYIEVKAPKDPTAPANAQSVVI